MSDKKKYYLRGLAMGMIFTCVVLMIVFKHNPTEPTDKEFAAMAEKRGYVLKGDNPTPSTSINLNDLKKTPAPTDTPLPSEPVKPSEPIKPTDTPVPTDTPAPTDTPTPTDIPAPTDTPVLFPTPGPDTTEMTVATIVVKPGDTSETVARLLYETKIIKDMNDFNRFIWSNKLSGNFYPGTFEVNDKMSYKELIYIFSCKRVLLP